MQRLVPRFLAGLIALVVIFILVVVFFPKAGERISPLASLILVLATLIYAWLNYGLVQQTSGSVDAMRQGNEISSRMIEEMRESRKQAATPVVTAEGVMSSGNSHFFKLTNVGNSPALNVLIGLETLPPAPNVARSQIVLRRIAFLPPRGGSGRGRFLAIHWQSGYQRLRYCRRLREHPWGGVRVRD